MVENIEGQQLAPAEGSTQEMQQEGQGDAALANGFMMFVAEHSGIDADDLEKLFYNGFDNPESFDLSTIEQLE